MVGWYWTSLDNSSDRVTKFVHTCRSRRNTMLPCQGRRNREGAYRYCVTTFGHMHLTLIALRDCSSSANTMLERYEAAVLGCVRPHDVDKCLVLSECCLFAFCRLIVYCWPQQRSFSVSSCFAVDTRFTLSNGNIVKIILITAYWTTHRSPRKNDVQKSPIVYCR